MLFVPRGAVIFTGCIIIYVIFLGVATYSPNKPAQFSNGVYDSLVGNTLNQVGNGSGNVSEDSVWDTCRLPNYDIWDEEILSYVNPDSDPLRTCDTSFKPFTKLKDSKWSVTKEGKDLICRARCHTRKSEQSNIVGNWSFNPGHVDCEILETACANKTDDVYGYLHAQVIPKPKEVPKVNITGLKQFDVFAILLDSISYSQAKRSLPRTLSYFTNHMKGVMFPYMNKVGDNSRPNGVALWHGKSLEKVDKTLFDMGVTPADWTNKYFCYTFKDNETSIFDEYREHGYRTLLAEDWAKGTYNWPDCVGLDKPKIDHYMRPFQNAYERSNHGTPLTQKHLNGHLCREYHHTLLDYLGDFADAYPDQKKFGWIWAIHLGHNSENNFAHADKDFHKFLMQHRKQLDNAFVFFLGDHGLRFGNVRSTFVGGLDVNNPLTALSIPKELRETTNMLQIMTENAKSLQTHYDTRATMLDILKYQSAANFKEENPSQIPGEKGNSYIRRQPSTPRVCRTMPIPFEYCLCQYNTITVPTDTVTARSIGVTLAKEVNKRIDEGGFTDKCIKMEFGKTVSLKKFVDKYKGATLYTATVEMKEPSKAEFRANVKIVNDQVHLLGLLERSNKYGKTADCIKAEYYRPYCYCEKQPKN